MTPHLETALVDTWFSAWSRSRGYRTDTEGGRRAARRTHRPATMIPGGSGRAALDVPATWEHVLVAPTAEDLDRLRSVLEEEPRTLATLFGESEHDPAELGLALQSDSERLMALEIDPEVQDVEPPRLPEGYVARVDEPVEGSRRLRIMAVGASTAPEGEEELAALGWVTFQDATAVFDRIWTSPQHRRRGLGSLVMRHLTSEVLGEGEVRRGLLVASPDGQKLYAHLGWTDLAPVTVWSRERVAGTAASEHTGTMGG